MKHTALLRLIAFISLSLFTIASAVAQEYPTRPIKLVVGYGAGGTADATARIYAEKLQTILKVPVIVDNKPGAYEQIAAQAVLSAPPDGYTLWWGTTGALTMGPGIRTNTPYDVIKNFTQIGKIAEVEAVLAVKKDSPINSLPDLIKFAKANPGKLFYASAGVGSGNHLLTEYIMNQTGIKMEHVPYKSDADVARELAAGTADFGIPVAGVAVPFVKEGKFKAIAVTGMQRLKQLPNVPTMGEEVPALNIGVYAIYGLLAPLGTPAPVVRTLSDAFNKVAEMPDVVSRLEATNVRPATSNPNDFRQYLEAEGKRWRELGKSLNITLN
ncbi:MAG TPA: tripartite tricarboxylate transporter substrate binding protein [Candidatus Acidoferrales bacterium]|nr:tripartite tricarboxylate transporter substrate binding protein [Candidatus Acidoferrales bacterium]